MSLTLRCTSEFCPSLKTCNWILNLLIYWHWSLTLYVSYYPFCGYSLTSILLTVQVLLVVLVSICGYSTVIMRAQPSVLVPFSSQLKFVFCMLLASKIHNLLIYLVQTGVQVYASELIVNCGTPERWQDATACFICDHASRITI